MYRRVARFNRARMKTSGRAPYITFNCHDNTSPGKSSLDSVTNCYPVSICAIDPAIKNCAIRIEKRYFKLKSNNEFTENLVPINNLDLSNPQKIETVLQVKFDMISSKIEDSRIPIVKKTRRKKGDPEPPKEEPIISTVDEENNMFYYVNFMKMFDSIISELCNCHYILIESQMPINTEMVRMSQAIITYLMIKTQNLYPVYPMIIEVDPKIKSSIFKAPSMKKPELKRWAAKKAIEILEENGDITTLEFLKAQSKKDDHGDVICYTTGWFKILETGGFFKPPM